MDAAADTATREKLVLYALALASGATASSDDQNWQAALVDAIRDLRHEHLDLLDRFTWTANRLGLGDGTEESERVPESLEQGQVEKVGVDIPALPSVLAVLQRHGLVATKPTGGGMAFYGSGARNVWQLTDFGRQVLETLRNLGRRLGGSREPFDAP